MGLFQTLLRGRTQPQSVPADAPEDSGALDVAAVERAAGTLDAQLALQAPRNADSHVPVDEYNAFLADRQRNGQRNALPAQNLHRLCQCGKGKHQQERGVAGAVASGTASGDWTLSCVRGQIRSLTFVFNDGTVRTFPAPAEEVNDNQSNNNQTASADQKTIQGGVECTAGTLDAQLALQIPRNANSHVSVDKDNAFLADRQWNGQRNTLPAQNLHRVDQ